MNWHPLRFLTLLLVITSIVTAIVAVYLYRARFSRSDMSISLGGHQSYVMFGFNPQHTHFNPYEHTLNSTNVSHLVPYWTALTHDSVASSPAVADGVAYIGSSDSSLYAFNAQTGATLWTASTGGQTSSPTVVGEVVYIGSGDGNIYAFSTKTRMLLWKSFTGVPIGDSSPTVINGVVYLSVDQFIFAFDAKTGSLLRTYLVKSNVYSSPAVANGVIYIGSYDELSHVYMMQAFNAKTGVTLWTVPTKGPCRNNLPIWGTIDSLQNWGNCFCTAPNAILSSPAVVDEVVYVGSADGTLCAFNAKTGVVLWTSPTGITSCRSRSSPAVADGIVYIGSTDNNLYAFDIKTGSMRWKASTGGIIDSSPTIANGVVYVGSYDHKLYAFNAKTGSVLWNHATGGYIDSSPAVVDGIVYIGSSDHRLYAFHL